MHTHTSGSEHVHSYQHEPCIYSFKVNSALLSRCKVFVLKRLDQDQIESILSRALEKWRGEEYQVDHDSKDKEAIKQLAVYSDGDGKWMDEQEEEKRGGGRGETMH